METENKISKNKGNVSVKDSEGNISVVKTNDPRYISGELVHMNKGRILYDVRGTFIAKDKDGNKFRITKNDIRYINGELVGITKRLFKKEKIKIIKIPKERKKVDEFGRKTMSCAQIQYQIKLRHQKYSEFNFDILSSKRNYLVKNFCEHGDLIILPSDFDMIYNKFNNNLNLYCEQCKKEYLKTINFSLKEIENNRKIIKSFNSARLKENYLKMKEPFVYQCILNTTQKDLPWQERTFLFKNNMVERPKCKFKDCNKETYFCSSNQRYAYFCATHLSGFISKGESEVLNFISRYYPNVKKFKFEGHELDIFISELNVAFEYNGLYFHNEFHKGKTYHYDKWKLCKERNIQLITIWEDQWLNKNDSVKSLILNKLQKIENKIYARECVIKEVSSENSNLFLEQNHLQGKCNASIKLGLYFNNELVSLMTFGKRNIGHKTQFEMIRFCSKIYTNVVGAASKLFKYFIDNYEFEKVISYANCDISNGSLYEKLNFKNLGHTGFNYWWTDNYTRFHRTNFMKHKISNKDNKGKTEENIMLNNGYNKIYGTGNLKYEYINKT